MATPRDIPCHVCGAAIGALCWPLADPPYCQGRINVAAEVTCDEVIYGNAFITADGYRIDPTRINATGGI